MSRGKRLALTTVKGLSALTDPLVGGKCTGPRILIYHQIGAGSGLEMDVSVSAFRGQLNWLTANGTVVDLSQALSEVAAAQPEDAFTITFDDGHASVYENAYPVLRDIGIPFTLYLSTGPLQASGFLHKNPSMPLMNWDQIGEMLASGLATVGAHSHDHIDMRKQSQPTIRRDLEKCDRVLEERLGVRAAHFAYPWGHWSEAADGLVRARYKSAVLGSGPGIKAGSDLFRLSRIPVMASDRGLLFRRKMWGGFRLESAARRVRDAFQ